MPKSVAAMLGLILVAVSIGFNTVRYPVVWETVGSAVMSQSVEPSVAMQSEVKDDVAPPSPPPTKPIEMNVISELTNPSEENHAAAVEVKVPSGEAMTVGQPELRKPLVPVIPVGTADMSGNAAIDGAGIRRLPPITQEAIAATNGMISVDNGGIPIYPTTGIQ